jgi:anthranilate synthase component I
MARETAMDPAGGHVLDVLRDLLPTYDAPLSADLPRFTGGAVGYMGYDLVRCFERLPNAPPDTLGLPLASFALCDRLLAYDHLKHRLLVIAHTRPAPSEEAARAEAEAAIDAIVACLEQPLPASLTAPLPTGPDLAVPPAAESAFGQAAYEEAVRQAREHIAAGDIFQVVLSRRAHRHTTARPFDIYRALRRVNPSPYMFFLDLPGDLTLIGSSPEVLVRVEDGVVTSRPLAGTRPRGATPEEDRALEEDLLADPKERAEHVMLVDLGRNDLGRGCAYGSGAHAHCSWRWSATPRDAHRQRRAGPTAAEGKDALDVLRACFPAGTVSGAPKVRAMEIIDSWRERAAPTPAPWATSATRQHGHLHHHPHHGHARQHLLYLQAGAGIVADSDPASEYRETENKLGALMRALAMVEREPSHKGEQA